MATEAKRDIYSEVTDRIIQAIEAGVPPWKRPWGGASDDGRPDWWPRNAVTGRPYNGINVWLLSMVGGDPRFVTYNQAQKAGGQVRKGEKGIPVTLWKTFPDKEDPKRMIPVLRGFTVFSVSQIDPIDPAKPPRWRTVEAVKRDKAWTSDRVNGAIKAIGCPIGYGGDRAFYAPALDRITLPKIEQFESEESAAATLLHEIVHATGHKSRMDRNLTGRFGDSAYAMEELIAEIGAAYLCAHTGVEGSPLNHASYIDSWLKVLRSDKRAIFTASSAAMAAAEWVSVRAGWSVEEPAEGADEE